MKKLLFKDCCELRTGKYNSCDAVENGTFPFFTCDPKTLSIDHFSFDQEAILLAGNNANGNFCIKYFYGKFDAYQRTYVIKSLSRELITKYLYYYLSTKLKEFTRLSTGSATRFLTKSIIDNVEIYCPNIDVQQHIVDTNTKELKYAY